MNRQGYLSGKAVISRIAGRQEGWQQILFFSIALAFFPKSLAAYLHAPRLQVLPLCIMPGLAQREANLTSRSRQMSSGETNRMAILPSVANPARQITHRATCGYRSCEKDEALSSWWVYEACPSACAPVNTHHCTCCAIRHITKALDPLHHAEEWPIRFQHTTAALLPKPD